MIPKLGISLLILTLLMQLSMAQNRLFQVDGGSEFRLSLNMAGYFRYYLSNIFQEKYSMV
ncbi:MAG: hypothetical protein IPN26_06730 [Bacteroidetes bacterium]|nr:hypothetical protein [Bacteroidota bacterium]